MIIPDKKVDKGKVLVYTSMYNFESNYWPQGAIVDHKLTFFISDAQKIIENIIRVRKLSKKGR